MRLSAAVVDRLAPAVARPAYDRDAQATGIVHLGIGAFHRAHQAVYTEGAMAGGDRDWRIAGVSLRSAGVRDALAPQDGLYTVTERGAAGTHTALVGALSEVVVAPERPNDVAALLARPQVHVVTLTVTEKAYFVRDGAVDLDAVAANTGTLYHLLAAGFAKRRAAGLPGLTILSCDNLAGNGVVLARGLASWLDRTDPALRRWFETECACPSTMVDRIVPAATQADLDRVASVVGARDEGAVITEPFRQWVIEDRFAGPRPRWEWAGAQFVAEVEPFEQAKLRLLNGAHSALAYLGLLAGYRYVHEAMADPSVAATVDSLMRQEAAASLSPAPEQDLPTYADALQRRFVNSSLPHRLAQIAADGSQKIPQRWLEPLAVNAKHGQRSPATLRALAAWMVYVRGDREPVVDPLAELLASTWASAGRAHIVEAIVGSNGILRGHWSPDVTDVTMLDEHISQLSM